MVTASDGNCNYKVTFKYRTKKCVYYINVETSGIVGNSECETALVEKGEAQCIVMESMKITKHEQSNIKADSDNGNEFLSQKSISVDKLRSIDIRLLKLIEMIESGYLSDSYIIQNAIEKYNYLREVALVMKSNQLDIPLREMSHHQNYSLDINKLSSNPKLALKCKR